MCLAEPNEHEHENAHDEEEEEQDEENVSEEQVAFFTAYAAYAAIPGTLPYYLVNLLRTIFEVDDAEARERYMFAVYRYWSHAVEIVTNAMEKKEQEINRQPEVIDMGFFLKLLVWKSKSIPRHKTARLEHLLTLLEIFVVNKTFEHILTAELDGIAAELQSLFLRDFVNESLCTQDSYPTLQYNMLDTFFNFDRYIANHTDADIPYHAVLDDNERDVRLEDRMFMTREDLNSTCFRIRQPWNPNHRWVSPSNPASPIRNDSVVVDDDEDDDDDEDEDEDEDEYMGVDELVVQALKRQRII
jgi:hypothetical protein